MMNEPGHKLTCISIVHFLKIILFLGLTILNKNHNYFGLSNKKIMQKLCYLITQPLKVFYLTN